MAFSKDHGMMRAAHATAGVEFKSACMACSFGVIYGSAYSPKTRATENVKAKVY